MKRLVTSCSLVALAACVSNAYAQIPLPDAGQIIIEQRQAPQLPQTRNSPLDIPIGYIDELDPGGPEVVISAIRIDGASVFTDEELFQVLGDFSGNAYDLAGLTELAEKLSAFYRLNGYPFARAFLPAQSIAEQTLVIEVVEGRFGQVIAMGDGEIELWAQKYLLPLHPGEVIEGTLLERTMLILSDQPGINVLPVMQPGEDMGSGDLYVQVDRIPAISVDLGLDNHGNRFTGENRLRANMQWDSPFTFGDQLWFRSLVTEESMWLGEINYSVPLGARGLRLQMGYTQTYYRLGEEFEVLDADGTGKIGSLGISYPIIRSQRSNLNISTNLYHKRFRDQRGSNIDENKFSNSLPLSLNFDHRDALGGGGITYGSVIYTAGKLKLDKDLLLQDFGTGQNTAGDFSKLNLDVLRVQALPANFSLFSRFSAQWASKNLDSSESFSLGGASGIRAYPSGEGIGDEGWLVQLELRYSVGNFLPYLFHDFGDVKVDAEPTLFSTEDRFLSGSGLGIRRQRDNLNFDASLAWRNHGGQAKSDSLDRNPRFWLSISYAFQ